MDQSQLSGLLFLIAFICAVAYWQLRLIEHEENRYKDGDDDDNDEDR